MNHHTNVLDYVINWISRSDPGFVGEVMFVKRKNSGGSVSTPVGYIVGFIEPASEYSTSYWKILLTIRDEVRYDTASNNTHVFVKSAYASKLEYYIHKLRELNRDVIRINPKLLTELQQTLTREGLCNSPLTMQMMVGKDEYFFSDVEFDLD